MYAILIPAYNPDRRLIEIVEEIIREEGPVVVVDDGSSPRSRAVFDEVSRQRGVTVLRHEVNRGKGCALKTGLSHIRRAHPDLAGAVLMDADGQHAVGDLRRVGGRLGAGERVLIIGERSLSRNVPFRSRLGNSFTSSLFSALTGVKIRDTQTGLRAIPMSLIPEFVALGGDRYEYEMEMLCFCCAHAIPIVEVPIETRYFDDNRASSFNPPVDSAKIIWTLLKNRFRSRRR